ncbi:MAG: RNA ligase family protein [Candidatus Binatia bacterium]|nr:RNA ligase family protein [Candidatus Binatia bacterium]
MEFESFQKLARLSRECVITEKIDGTNGCIAIGDGGEFYVGSRSRWITLDDDNFGFARWAHENKAELLKLGPGRHYGEWWGAGIQRRYGLSEKRFSLFNTHRWSDALGARPACCHVVPVLATGIFSSVMVESVMLSLVEIGSHAAPGFMEPEGIVIFHTAAGHFFKKTIKGDEEGKHAEAHPPKPKIPRPPKDPSKGGRRIAQLPYEGPDKRK